MQLISSWSSSSNKRAAKDAATAQRVLRECAQAERVIKEDCQAHVAQETTQAQVTALPTIEIEEPNDITESLQGIQQITQDEYNEQTTRPLANTQQQQET
jgi:hypothetical protein